MIAITIIMQYNNGLKFSFSLRSQTPPSLHSTPKFPSIEIQKQIRENRPKEKPFLKQAANITVYPTSPNNKERPSRPESKGKRILQKYSHLTLLAHKEKQEKDSKSVRSIQSSKSYKYYRSKTQTSQSLTKSVKNRHSSVSYANLNAQITLAKSKTKTRTPSKESSKFQLREEPYRRQLFEERSVGRLMNNYIEHAKTEKSKKTDQILIFEQPIRPPCIPDKGKSFKSILRKARPVLKIGSRLLKTQKLQQEQRPFSIHENVHQF